MGAGDEVRYGIEVVGETIPGRDGRAGKRDPNRYRPLRDKVDEVRGDEKYWRTWVAIADYASSAVAGGAMRDLKHHYGDEPEINGLTFTTHRYAIQDAESGEVVRDSMGAIVKRCKLIVKYEPERIDEGRRKSWGRDQVLIRGRKAAEKLGIDIDQLDGIRREGV